MTDFDGVQAAAAIVAALGIFSQVDSGFEPSGPDPQPVLTPYCWFRPARWTTTESTGGGPSEVRVRTVWFEAQITTTPGETAAPPEQLAQAIEDALQGVALADSLPTLTRVESGRYGQHGQSAKARQHLLILEGQFSYLY